jgi:ribosomal protein S18 acetylase RimI-like enzyme
MAVPQMISIRRAVPNEADTLTQLAFSAKGHWGYPEHWMELWKPQLTFSPEYVEEYESWVAEMGQTLVGFYTLLEKHGSAWIENLWVLPEWIGKGVGKMMFFHALETARQRGFERLQLEADPNAVGFYEKMGMKKIGERISEIEGQPRILPIMELRI